VNISRVSITRLRDGRWHLSFDAGSWQVYEEKFNELDTALGLMRGGIVVGHVDWS